MSNTIREYIYTYIYIYIYKEGLILEPLNEVIIRLRVCLYFYQNILDPRQNILDQH